MEIPVPKPKSGQVLIKVECAPIYPCDIFFKQGNFMLGVHEDEIHELGGHIEYPLALGVEGSGTVVQSGGGLMAWRLLGKKVSFTMEGANFTFKSGGSY